VWSPLSLLCWAHSRILRAGPTDSHSRSETMLSLCRHCGAGCIGTYCGSAARPTRRFMTRDTAAANFPSSSATVRFSACFCLFRHRSRSPQEASPRSEPNRGTSPFSHHIACPPRACPGCEPALLCRQPLPQLRHSRHLPRR